MLAGCEKTSKSYEKWTPSEENGFFEALKVRARNENTSDDIDIASHSKGEGGNSGAGPLPWWLQASGPDFDKMAEHLHMSKNRVRSYYHHELKRMNAMLEPLGVAVDAKDNEEVCAAMLSWCVSNFTLYACWCVACQSAKAHSRRRCSD